jgi:hypothetical protein
MGKLENEMKPVAIIAMFCALVAFAQASSSLAACYLVLIEGTDTTLESREFTVRDNWTVTCRCAHTGPNCDVTIYADPAAGTENLAVIHMDRDGEKTVTIRDGGRYKIVVNGWDASFNVFVENSK